MTSNPVVPAWTVVLHTVVQGAVWLVPLIFLAYPHLGDLTISAVGSLIVGYLNNKYLVTAK